MNFLLAITYLPFWMRLLIFQEYFFSPSPPPCPPPPSHHKKYDDHHHWVGLAIKLLLHARKPSLDRWWPTVVTAWEFNLFIIIITIITPTMTIIITNIIIIITIVIIGVIIVIIIIIINMDWSLPTIIILTGSLPVEDQSPFS